MHLIDFKWLKLKAWRVKVEHKCVRDFNILNIFTGAEILALTISWSRWEFAVYVHLLCWTVSGLILWMNKRSCLLIHQNNEKGCKHNRNNITYKSFCCWCQKGNRKGLIKGYLPTIALEVLLQMVKVIFIYLNCYECK